MAQFVIQGGKKLKGEVKISGNKNSILPCLAACLLTDEEVTLENVPKISDVEVFLEILQNMGAQVSYSDEEVRVKAEKITNQTITEEQSRKLRASILFAGALLSRVGQAQFFRPGGDLIGTRSIEAHLEGFKALGANIKQDDLKYKVSLGKSSKDLAIFLDEPSVTATENLIMAVVLGQRTVILKNCAQEPHIVDLCSLLRKMGAKIDGVGTNTLKIEGVNKLNGAEFRIGCDYMEFGTYAVASAITGGEITLKNCSLEGMEPITYTLSKMGLNFEESERGVKVWAKKILPAPHLKPNIWPGFPTDLMSAMIVLATQAQGMSLLHDWMYETRMFFVDKLISMGANITIADPHRVLVYGPTPLHGRQVETPDIRAGMALVLAALITDGKSIIDRIELIDRGYSNVEQNLLSLGADIRRSPL